MKPSAEFAGYQGNYDGSWSATYDVHGGGRHKSTVSAATLKALKIKVPKTPPPPPKQKPYKPIARRGMKKAEAIINAIDAMRA